MDNKCIGVFDSGLGGLTAVKQIINELPKEDIIYFGDTGRVPYGSRSKETLLKYTRGDIRFLNTFDVKIIVIACGTASSAALPAIKDEFDVPIIGVIDAAVYAAVRATKNKKIGVIGTAGTIKSGEYEKQIKAYDREMQTFAKACPMFVPLVENGYFDTEVTRIIVAEYLEEIRNQGVDTLILGCTMRSFQYAFAVSTSVGISLPLLYQLANKIPRIGVPSGDCHIISEYGDS